MSCLSTMVRPDSSNEGERTLSEQGVLCWASRDRHEMDERRKRRDDDFTRRAKRSMAPCSEI